MSLEDNLKRSNPTPDDIDDLRDFAFAISKRLPEKNAERLIENFIFLSLKMSSIIEEIRSLPISRIDGAFQMSCLVQIFKLLKKNEYAVRELLNIGEAGEVFLDEHF